MDDITTCYERGGQPEWDNTDYGRDYVWLGFDRSTFPIFTSKLPAPESGAIALENVRRFARELKIAGDK